MTADQEREFAQSTDRKRGLTADMVEKRQLEWGYNELPSKTRHPLLVFLSYFWGPMPIMICECAPPLLSPQPAAAAAAPSARSCVLAFVRGEVLQPARVLTTPPPSSAARLHPTRRRAPSPARPSLSPLAQGSLRASSWPRLRRDLAAGRSLPCS